MAYRRLQIDVISATDLKKVNLIDKTHAYAIVSISGHPKVSQQQRTAVDRSGNASPTWNFPLTFAVEESATRSNRLVVTFRIRCKRTLGDKDIGAVHVPLSELNGPTEDGELLQSVTYQVRSQSGKPKGELNFSYKWGPKMASSQDPVTAYPAQVGPSPFSLPPPTGYPYPYPPPQPVYVYLPPPPDQKPQKNNWWAKFLCVETVKLCLGYVIADDF
ncbi:hypothetical protein RHSIM_Rhsim02G0010700 [Rhododendron simsii]|uniref:C2 domain-containing protein n=1 Tax=Rhododendron simsii TaxID=118357 RepID=A0A834LWK7_RHOSS|nr:hypothetical protein RHSIM_Rhsim02G0010700 [Rhododendron simsii]